MGRRSGLRAELGGEAIYAWVVGEHLRDIKECSRNVQDGGRSYHAAVNEFLAFVGEDIGYFLPPTTVKDGATIENPGSWEVWQRKNLLNPDGTPATRLTKTHRRMEVAHAVGILRTKKSVLGYTKAPFSNDAKRIEGGMDKLLAIAGQGQVTAADKDEDDDE